MPTTRGNPIRCPECNRLGSNDVTINHLCKACVSKKTCTQCGEPAFGYIEKSPLHSWYCKYHYVEQMKRFTEEIEHIFTDKLADNSFTNSDEFVPETDEVALVKDKYGYER